MVAKLAICSDTTAGGHDGCAALVVMTRDEAGGFCMGWPADALPVRVGPKTEKPPLWPCPDADAFARFLASHDRVVTGRFHACASSLYKVEATLRDIGLDGQRLLVLSGPMPDLLRCAASERDAIADALANVRSSAADMIAQVLAH